MQRVKSIASPWPPPTTPASPALSGRQHRSRQHDRGARQDRGQRLRQRLDPRLRDDRLQGCSPNGSASAARGVAARPVHHVRRHRGRAVAARDGLQPPGREGRRRGPKRSQPGWPTRAIRARGDRRMAKVRAVTQRPGGDASAGIGDPADVHFVQIKCPLLTPSAPGRRPPWPARGDHEYLRIDGVLARRIGARRGACARRGAEGRMTDDAIAADWSLTSGVASTSAGIELMNCEIIVMGNAAGSETDLVVGHGVMRDAIDADAVREALGAAAVAAASGGRRRAHRERLRQGRGPPSGAIRGRRHTMLNDSDINNTRHARAVERGDCVDRRRADGVRLRRRGAPGAARRRARRGDRAASVEHEIARRRRLVT